MDEVNLNNDKLKETLKSLKPNLNPEHDIVFSNIVKEPSDILLYIFSVIYYNRKYFQKNYKLQGCAQFIRKMKIFFWQITDQCQFFCAFLNWLNLWCNDLFKYLSEKTILYKKQFGFQTAHNIEHIFLQLCQSFDKKNRWGTFIDRSKVFNVVDHKILTKKLELYEITTRSLRWFESYLWNRSSF